MRESLQDVIEGLLLRATVAVGDSNQTWISTKTPDLAGAKGIVRQGRDVGRDPKNAQRNEERDGKLLRDWVESVRAFSSA